MRLLLFVAFLTGTNYCFSQNQFASHPLTFSQDPQGSLNWIDLDNDGDLDVINHSPSYYIFNIYENVNNEFVLLENPFNSVYISPPKYAVADYDNDNDIDLLLMDMQNLVIATNQGNISFDISFTTINGNSYPSVVHWVDINGDMIYDLVLDNLIFLKENTDYTLSNIKLPNFVSNLHWADLNNDGLTDFISTKGNTLNSNPLNVFLNKGEGIFDEGDMLAPVLYDEAQIILLDIDNDSDTDLIFHNPDGKVKLLKNQFSQSGVVSFIEVYSIVKFDASKIAVGDINADNLPDIVLHGSTFYGSYSTYAFVNSSSPDLVEFTETDLGISSDITEHFGFVDFDRDGDLDINVSGVKDASNFVYQVLIYENTQGTLPSVPLTPTNLGANVKSSVELYWVSSEDQPNYNLEIKRNGVVIKSALTLSDGTSLWPGTTELSSSKKRQLINLPEGNYEWSVQAINHAKRASGFSSKSNFTIKAPPANLSFEIIDVTEIKLSWQFTGQDATAFAIFRKSTNSPFIELATVPANETTFRDNTIPANELHEYTVKAVFGEVYSSPSNSVKYFSGQFNEEPFDLNVANIIESVAVSADFDKDSDYDLGIIGRIDYQFGNALILNNDGNGTYNRSTFIPTLNEPYSHIIRSKDMDNDGDTDVSVVFGSDYSWKQVMVYHNQNGLFTKVFETAQLLGINQLEIEDINHDGRQDIIYAHTLGNSPGNPIVFKILFQNPNGEFIDSTIELTTTDIESYSRVKISDLNNDGYKDIFLFGNTLKPKLFLSQNGNAFKEVSTATFPLLGEPLFYDFNGDGKTDLIQGGNTTLEFYAGLGDLKFADPFEVSLGDMGYSQPFEILIADFDLNGMSDIIVNDGYRVGVLQGALNGGYTLSDYKFASGPSTQLQITNMDNDQDLDVIKLGTDGQHQGVHYFYRNQIATDNKGNSSPTAPASVQVTHTNQGTNISWSPATDSETPQNFLTYNVHIVDANGKSWLHSENNTNNNFRYRLAPGNAGTRTTFLVNNLPHGTYRVFVQALDASFAMSPISPEVSFSIAPGPSSLTVERILLNKVKLSWVNPATANMKIIVERRLEDVDFEIIAELPPTTTQFIDENLSYNQKYTYRVYGILTNTPTSNSNTVNWNTALFLAKEFDIPNVYGSLDAGDFNKDGQMDLIIVGGRITNGSYSEIIGDLFENTNNGFTRNKIGSTILNHTSNFQFLDFNGDGLLDIYQQGYIYNENRYQTELFKNNGDKTFSPIENIITTNDYQILNTWDYDMDNDIDLVVAKANTYGLQQILKNQGDGVYEVDATQDSNCNNCIRNAMIGDFNKDGLEDVWRPNNSGGYNLYLNSASGLIDAKIEPIGFYGITFKVVDYNGDGWNDIIAISNEYYFATRIYKNLGYDEVNKKYLGFKMVRDFLPYYNTSVTTADFDHDGDIDLLFASGISKLYLNEGNDIFTEIRVPNISISIHGSRLIDIDSDGDLDMYVMGYFRNFDSGEYTKGVVIENQMIVSGKGITNLPPAKPVSLTAEQDEMGMHLAWQPAPDDHTATSSQTFDLIVYQQGKSVSKVAVNDATGLRMKLQAGGSTTSSHTINNLVPGEYTWRVQAVDQSYLGSEFSVSANFLFRPKAPTGIQDTVVYKCGRTVNLTAKGEQIEWFSDAAATVKIASGPTYQPLASQIVYVTQTENGLRSVSKKVNITIADKPDQPVVTNSNPLLYCENTSPGSYYYVIAQGQNLKWYADVNKTNLIKEKDEYLQVFTVEKNYYVTQTIQNCESNATEIKVKPLLIESQIYIENGKLRVKEEGGTSYTWYRNNLLLAGQNTFILNQGFEAGTYLVSIMKGACFETSTSFVVTGLGEDAVGFSFYPNPASKGLTVQLNKESASKIDVMDITGRILYTREISDSANSEIEITVDRWGDGVYFLRYYKGNEIKVNKFVVKK